MECKVVKLDIMRAYWYRREEESADEIATAVKSTLLSHLPDLVPSVLGRRLPTSHVLASARTV